MDVVPCPRCQSRRTIRTEIGLRFEYWRCFGCGKHYDLKRATETDAPQRRPVTDYQRAVTR